MKQFAQYHPIVNFIYFAAVLLISMFSMHPVIIGIALIMSVIFNLQLKGVGKTVRFLGCLVAMAMMIAIINPLFNHQGITILYYFHNGNPLTLESIIYGGFMAGLLTSVIMWFSVYNEVMTSDKFIYLFGRIAPHISLVLSMIFRFVPRFKNQFRQVREAQKCIGKDLGQGNVIERIGHFVNELSILISWSMENSIEIADSMKARGYGLSGRTSYSIYDFKRRDGVLLVAVVLLTGSFAALAAGGQLYFRYYPTFENALFSGTSLTAYGIFIILCALPAMAQLSFTAAVRLPLPALIQQRLSLIKSVTKE